MTNKMQQF